jgi:hypothetical protein
MKYRIKLFQCTRKSYVLFATLIAEATQIHSFLDMTCCFRGMILLLHQSIMQMNINCGIVDTDYLRNNSDVDQYRSVLDKMIRKLNDTQIWNDQSGLQVIVASAA